MLTHTHLIVLVTLFVVILASQSNQDETTSSPEVCTGASTCGDCMKVGVKCLWCGEGNGTCMDYPVGEVIPSSHTCKLSKARWGTCNVNYEALLICVGILAGIILIPLLYCCCKCMVKCLCLDKRADKKYRQDEAKFDSDQQARSAKHDERRAERKDRLDEIRKKYALEIKGIGNQSPGYERFDA